MDNSLHIYVVGHKKTFIPKCDYLIPIQAGCAQADTLYPGYVRDDSGDNISDRNKDYCELTALYWLWKNDGAPFAGLFHYRRFMAFETRSLKRHMNNWKNFYYAESLTQSLFDTFGYGEGSNIERAKEYDILIPKRSYLKLRNIDSFYGLYERDYKEELDHALGIVRRRFPEYGQAIEQCKASPRGYHCNMFIMRREVLDEYCEWLFAVLDEMYREIREGAFETGKERLMGYLAEFMMGVFVCQKRGKLKIGELPAVFFRFTDGRGHRARKCADLLLGGMYRAAFPLGSGREQRMFRLLDDFRVGRGRRG